MDRHSIIKLPNDVLRQKSRKVKVVNDKVKQLIKDMKAATLDWEDHREHEFGVALAAVQVNNLSRVVVIRNDFKDKEDKTFTVLINPQIIRTEGEEIEDYEGCLSVPDVYGKLKRWSKVKIKALDENGREFRIKAEGFLARIIQHEIDHTNGIVLIDHIKGQDKFYHLGTEGKLEKVALDEVEAADILW